MNNENVTHPEEGNGLFGLMQTADSRAVESHSPADVQGIFVVGCPRSGTTLVQSLLAAHTKVVAFTEGHLFDKGFLSVGAWSFVRKRRLKQFVARFIDENEHLPASASARLAACDQARSASDAARHIVATLDETARACGAPYWVEKTPDNVFRISLIRSVAPQARFIHVIRRADAVLPSLYLASRQWGREKSWLSCALHWSAAVWTSALCAHGKNHLVVAYEDLVRQRKEVAQAMLAWIGLDWEEGVLTDFPQAAARCVASNETWKAANFQAAPPDSSAASLRAPWFARAITSLGPYESLRRKSPYA